MKNIKKYFFSFANSPIFHIIRSIIVYRNMEFLFWNQIASFEAITILLCVALIWAIFLYDGYLFLARIIWVLTPRKEYIKEKLAEQGLEEKTEIPLSVQDILAKEETRLEEESIRSPLEEENITGDTGDKTDEGAISDQTDDTTPIPEKEALSTEDELHKDDSINERDESIEILPKDTAEELIDTPEESAIIESSPDSDSSEESKYEAMKEDEIEGSSMDVELQEVIVDDTSIEENSVETEGIPTEDPIPEKIAEESEVRNTDDTLALEGLRVEDVFTEETPKEIESPETDTTTYIPPPKRVIPEAVKPAPSQPQLSPEKRDKLVEITNTVRTFIARGHIVEARALIIEWLSISKNHRDLNVILAELYERDHAFEKAEFIYKDLAHFYPDDAELIMHLANTLAMQHKYRVSYELYKKVLSLAWETEEILYTLTHLASELWEIDDTYEYARSYTKQYPKNPEILWLLSQSQIATGRRKDAIETLIKLKNLTPYSQEIVDLIGKLVTEEEMAGNFGGEK